MEDDVTVDMQDESVADAADTDDELLAARPKGGSQITDGSSNT